jgi:hypothetical protein
MEKQFPNCRRTGWCWEFAGSERHKAQKTAQFTQALENMKILAEGGTLPPAPPRGCGAQPGGAQVR